MPPPRKHFLLEIPTLSLPLGEGKKAASRKCAFTLAEALLSICIISAVAAYTMPILIVKYQKHMTVNKVKTAYNILYNAIEESKLKNGPIMYWKKPLTNGEGHQEFAERYILPYLNITGKAKHHYMKTLCTSGHGAYGYLYWNDVPANHNKYPIYTMSNGMEFTPRYENGNLMITVDINGPKGPNRMGIDGFAFKLDTKRNELVPSGYGYPREYLTGDVGGDSYVGGCVRDDKWMYYRGGYCAALMMLDGWQIKDHYPWGNGK